MWVLASRRSRPITMWRTTAPAEWSVAVPTASTLRVIVRVLLDAPVTSTISSRAVSGSSTMVKVAFALIDAADTVANKIDAFDTLIVAPPDVTAEVRVVCWERDV